jgi:hypothetical protein
MFVKKGNNDNLPNNIYQPKFGTKLRPINYIPEGTIHKFFNRKQSQAELKERHFNDGKPVVKNQKVRLPLLFY